jgi:uncharacterized integral membrane protein (TIGR02327 family)
MQMMNIVLVLACIALAWWALQSIRLDLFVKQVNGPQAKMLLILASIVIGYTVASFFIEYLTWFSGLQSTFSLASS